ncbi:PilZ domain-containing protein [Magnetococcus sp. PR-3]|uniref:PilZ domain-containing protein n=1 Tax=Magnetococcus sp. PR-3 TaxID=3120355 RepID=UPI002FCE5ADB
MNQRNHFRLHDTSILTHVRRLLSSKRAVSLKRGEGGALEGKWQQVTLWDISAGGYSFVFPEDSLRSGDKIESRIALAEVGDVSPMQLRSVIVGGRSHDKFGAHRYFCKFDSMRPHEAETLARHIQNRQRTQLLEETEKTWEEDAEWEAQANAWEEQDLPEDLDDDMVQVTEDDEAPKRKKKKKFRFGQALPTVAVEKKDDGPKAPPRKERAFDRVDEVIPFVWRKITPEEYAEAEEQFNAGQPLPQAFKTGYQPIDVKPLKRCWTVIQVQSPGAALNLEKLWERVDSLCAQVSANKKVNLFVPLRDQLVQTTNLLVNHNMVNAGQTDTLSRIENILADVVSDHGRATVESRKQRRELIKRVRDDVRNLKRTGTSMSDGIPELFERLTDVIDKINIFGYDHVFGHSPQDLNLSGGGIAFVEEAVKSTGQTLLKRKDKGGDGSEIIPLKRGDHVVARVGLHADPWRWIFAYGTVVMVKSLSRRASAHMDKHGGILPPRRVAVEFTLIDEDDVQALIAATHSKQLDERRKAYAEDDEVW